MQIKIRKYKSSDLREAASVISKGSEILIERETKKASQAYTDSYNPKKTPLKEIESQFARTPIIFVAEYKGKIAGVIRGRLRGKEARIVNWFVLPGYRGKGIGGKLIDKFEQETFKKSGMIRVRASLYATPHYAKKGYKKTTGIRMFHGMKVQPMVKIK